MNITNRTHFRLDNVAMGTEQALKVRSSNKEFEVVGDGKIDGYMMDGFHSATAVQSIKDPRLMAFRDEAYAKKGDYHFGGDAFEMTKRHFGPSWTTESDRNIVTLTHQEGDSVLRLVVDAHNKTTDLSATVHTAETSLKQGVREERDKEPTEYLVWEPSKAASAESYARKNESLRRYSESLI